jgi:hypothetical protein
MITLALMFLAGFTMISVGSFLISLPVGLIVTGAVSVILSTVFAQIEQLKNYEEEQK